MALTEEQVQLMRSFSQGLPDLYSPLPECPVPCTGMNGILLSPPPLMASGS
jgi:hypothetical protein